MSDLHKKYEKDLKGYITGKPPFYVETASVKGDESWGIWIVRNQHCNVLGKLFVDKESAEELASKLNQIVKDDQETPPT